VIYSTFGNDGGRRLAYLDDVFKNTPCILMGGAPTIKDQPLALLEQRGVLSAAINNAARHFQPNLWFCADNPHCYEPQIVMDPCVMKFMSYSYHKVETRRAMSEMPNTFFYITDNEVPIASMLERTRYTPFYKNTLLTAIHILYQLGVRTIILGGSDFEFGEDVYAHKDGLTDQEKVLNSRLYGSLAEELIGLKPVFDQYGLRLMDCSVKSKLGGTYETLTMKEAADLCREGFPDKMMDPEDLPHGTRFASEEMKKRLGVIDVEEKPEKKHFV